MSVYLKARIVEIWLAKSWRFRWSIIVQSWASYVSMGQGPQHRNYSKCRFYKLRIVLAQGAQFTIQNLLFILLILEQDFRCFSVLGGWDNSHRSACLFFYSYDAI